MMPEWEWGEQRDKCARALALAADADLAGLFRPRAPDPALLRTWAKTVRAPAAAPARTLLRPQTMFNKRSRSCSRLCLWS